MIFKTAFSNTIKNIKQPWPVVEVESDEFDNIEISNFYRNHKYVWVVNKKYKTDILKTFDWSYSPQHDEYNMHLFPLCYDDTKAPVIWDALKLIPINNTKILTKSNIIAGYINTPFYYTMYERGLINKVLSKNNEHRFRVAKTKPTFKEIIKNFNFKNYNKDYVLFVDVDVTLNSSYNFKLPESSENNTLYHYKVTHQSTGLSYADNSVVFVPYSYIHALNNNIEYNINHVVIDDIVGDLNDIADPEFAWARAYSTTGLILTSKFLYKERKFTNKILSSYLSANCKFSNYVASGCSNASENLENNSDIDFEDFKFISKNFLEYNKKINHANEELKPMLSKLEMIKKVYGIDSEQYKALLAKSERV
jgi:hypothetical protein